MDRDKQDKLKKDIVEMYCVSKDMILYCEEIDELQNTDPRFLNELKMGFDHLMRVFAVDFKIKEESEEYVEENLNKCFDHVYRAGYDALDWVSMSLRYSIYKDMQNFSNEAITAIIPEYYKEIKPDVEDLHKKIAGFRNKKDIGHRDIEGFIEYASKVDILRKYHADILKKKPALVEYDRKLNNEKRGELFKQFIILSITGGAIAGIIIAIAIKYLIH